VITRIDNITIPIRSKFNWNFKFAQRLVIQIKSLLLATLSAIQLKIDKYLNNWSKISYLDYKFGKVHSNCVNFFKKKL
jgi:hypothetical protein